MLSILRDKKWILTSLLLFSSTLCFALSNLTKNDPLPPYTTMDPHAFLYTRTKDQMHGRTEKEEKLNRFSLYLSPFGQNANIGRDFNNTEAQLGSLNAKWSMIAALFGETPEGQTLSPTLATARTKLFPTFSTTTPINELNEIDCEENFGFFEFPAEYRKRGFRFQLSVGILEDLGFMIQSGFSDINFNVACPVNLTDEAAPNDCKTLSETDVNKYLMCELREIACELGLDMSNFHESSVEDIRLSLFWRKAFEVNEDEEGWPKLLVVPFFTAGVGLATGKEKDPLRSFGMPFGNNGHNSIGFTGGLNLDFTETIEVGFEVGATHFFENSFTNFPMPTSEVQSGIFPFKTNVTIDPGYNWTFNLNMKARHFLGKLSFYFQWIVSEHKNDKINACQNPAFKPEALEKRSGWKVQVINTALNYDVSKNINLGFLWQAPVSQRNAFRSTTAMFGINFTF